MIDDDTIIETPESPPLKMKRKGWPKGKPRRKKPEPSAETKAAPVAFSTYHDLAGITVDVCPKACNAQRCVISGTYYCAHPHKGGLQMISMQDAAALERLKAAKKLLGKRMVEAKYA